VAVSLALHKSKRVYGAIPFAAGYTDMQLSGWSEAIDIPRNCQHYIHCIEIEHRALTSDEIKASTSSTSCNGYVDVELNGVGQVRKKKIRTVFRPSASFRDCPSNILSGHFDITKLAMNAILRESNI
jgi:hypothetical protein